MPKRGIDVRSAEIQEDAEVAHLIGLWKWPRRRMNKGDLQWLARCARRPFFMSGPKNSLASIGLRDGLDDEDRGARFMKLFSEYPDEAAAFWIFIREKHRKEFLSESPAANARRFISSYRLVRRLSSAGLKKDEFVNWARSKFRNNSELNAALLDIENMFSGMITGPLTEAELAEEFGRECGNRHGAKGPIAEAIQHARGDISGKKHKKNPAIGD